MAQQIVIDIVAETKKLTSGIDDANKQLDGMSKGLKTAATAAAGLASAFVLKQGVSFLKDGIEEAKDARTAMIAATSAFGEGSEAIQQITKDAEKFGKELAVDNDDIIKLATAVGVKLPRDAKKASAQLVLLAKNLEATSGGSIAAEATLSKLGKAFADGELSAKELSKAIPGLDNATIKMVETLSKAGKNQEALNLLIEAGEKKYGGAAAAQVTATQKFDVALANLKETIGTKVLPILESAVNFLTKLLDAFSALPGPVQNLVIGLTAIVGIGGPLLGFLASMKTSLEVLGVAKIFATTQVNLFSLALKAIPILAIISLIVLLIANWDEVSATAKKTWEAVSKWFGAIYDDIKELLGKAIDWVKENWPKLIVVLTGPFGLFAAYLIRHKDEILATLTNGWTAVKDKVLEIVEATIRGVSGWWNSLRDYIATLFTETPNSMFSVIVSGWNIVKEFMANVFELIYVSTIKQWIEIFLGIVDYVTRIKLGVVDKFNELKDASIEAFKKLQRAASEIWGLIKDYIGSAVDNIKNKFGEVYGKMVEVGKDIARGIGAGLTSMTGWFKSLLGDWIQRNIPDWAKTILKISSPSKVFAGIGTNIVEGLAQGITGTSSIGAPARLSTASSTTAAPINITINAGLGTDPYSLGRAVDSAVSKYGTISKRSVGAIL